VTKERKEIPENIKSFIRERNQLDYQLYKYVRARFQQQLEEHSEILNQLVVFRRYLEAFQKKTGKPKIKPHRDSEPK
jgi:hypothetical protein